MAVVASSATMLAVASSGLGWQCMMGGADQTGVSYPCSVRRSSRRGAPAMPFYLTRGLILNSELQFISGSLFGDTLLMHYYQQNIRHAQELSPGGQCTAAGAGVGAMTKEPVTGIEFSKTVKPPGATTELALVGAGVREKKIAFLKVKVYAVGFYIDASSVANSPMGVWKGKSESELSRDGAFFKALVAAPLEKALKIVLARDIEGSQFWGALDEALTPRLKAAAGGSAGQEALASFGNVFRDRALKQGTTVFLTWSQPATLQIAISSPKGSSPAALDATIDSAVLLFCLFDVYLGQNPVSPSAKDSVVTGFSSLV